MKFSLGWNCKILTQMQLIVKKVGGQFFSAVTISSRDIESVWYEVTF